MNKKKQSTLIFKFLKKQKPYIDKRLADFIPSAFYVVLPLQIICQTFLVLFFVRDIIDSERVAKMKLKKIISIFLSLLMFLTAFVIPVNATGKSDLSTVNAISKDDIASVSSLQAYQNYLDRIVTLKDFSGVAYVTQNGRVLCQSANGMQNTADSKDMTIDSLFPVGSVSKQFCATAILLLQEQGKLSVDEKITKYFPEYEIGKDITIKHLLSMRSGIRDHVNPDYAYTGHEIPFEEYTVTKTATASENKQIITDWLFTQHLKFSPGNNFSYSNSNFLLLSMIVEQVSGMSYSDFVKQNIFEPLKMTNTGFCEELVDSPDLAEHHMDGELIEPYHRGLSHGAGDIVSNAKDMDKWLTSLSDCTLLCEKSFKEMTTDYSFGNGYGFGIMIDESNGSIYHAGNFASYESMVIIFPAEDINIFVVTNDVEKMYKKNLPMNTFAFAISKKVNSGIMLGDVDGDNEVSILDATAIQLHIAQRKTLTDEQIERGDTDADGELSILDACAIQLFIANK